MATMAVILQQQLMLAAISGRAAADSEVPGTDGPAEGELLVGTQPPVIGLQQQLPRMARP